MYIRRLWERKTRLVRLAALKWDGLGLRPTWVSQANSAGMFQICWATSTSHRNSWHSKWGLFAVETLFHLFCFLLLSSAAALVNFLLLYKVIDHQASVGACMFWIFSYRGKGNVRFNTFVIIGFQISCARKFVRCLGQSPHGCYLFCEQAAWINVVRISGSIWLTFRQCSFATGTY